MRQVLHYCIVAILLFSCTSEEKSPSWSALEQKVDSLVRPWIKDSKLAGIAVAVYKNNKKKLLKSYGFADLELDVKLPVNASFEIGSITKQFTAAAILQLAEQGKLGLDDDIIKYIDFDTQGKKVTIRHLLSHTSGIKGYTELPSFGRISMQEFPRDTLLRIVENESFDFEPGEALIYNNTGFFMLGLIIEKVSGLTYEEYLMKNLFEKAGMTNSYYCSDSKIIKNRAHGYDTGESGLVRAAYLDHTWPYAAGSICSTPEDLVKWNDALHHGKILRDKMYSELITPAVLNDGTVTQYAKGIVVAERNGKRLILHGGGINGFRSENIYVPDDDVSVIILVNTLGPVAPRQVADFIIDNIFAKPANEVPVFNGELSRFPGIYKGRGRGRDLMVYITGSDSTITAQFGENPPRRLKYFRDNSWSDGNTTFMFTRMEGKWFRELRIDEAYGFYILNRTQIPL